MATNEYDAFIKHYGRKGMKWHKNIFTGETYAYPSNEDMDAEIENSLFKEQNEWVKKLGRDDLLEPIKKSTDSLDTHDSKDNFFDKVVESGKDLLNSLFSGGYVDIGEYKYSRRGPNGGRRVVKK